MINETWGRLIFFSAIIILLAGMSITRNFVWKDDLILWSDVVRKAPENPRGLYNVALGLHARDNLEKALLNLQKIVALKKHNWFVLSEIGAVYTDMGLFDEALLWHDRAIALKPDSPDVWSFLGITYVKMGELDMALNAFEKSLGFKRDSSSTHYFLGNIYRQIDVERAFEHYEEAIRLNPEYYEALIDLANLYDDTSNPEKAFLLYQRAIYLYPNAPEAYYNLGVFYERRGYVKDAVDNYRNALRIKPDYEKPAERLRLMREIDTLPLQ